MMTYLFLIRHGETPWTRERRFQGHTNTELTARGRRQAEILGRRMKKVPLDVLYASPLKRAAQTAHFMTRAGLKIRYDERVKELGFGRWEGKTPYDLLAQKDGHYARWCKGSLVTPPGGESLLEFRRRIAVFLKEILRRHPGKKIGIVTHGGPVKMFIYEALKLPHRSLWSFRIEPASLTVLGIGHVGQLFSLSDTSHLEKHGLGIIPDYLVTKKPKS